MRDLSDDELADYHVNERINDRGVLLDKPLAEAAIKYASVELEEIESLVQELTEGEIQSVRSPRMKKEAEKKVEEKKAPMTLEGMVKAIQTAVEKLEMKLPQPVMV